MQTTDITKELDNLSSKVSTGAFWIFLFQILDNVLGFLRLLILARVLTPTDFGLVGIAWLILQIITAFTQTGIQQTLIHRKDTEKYLSTAWTFLLIRGALLYGLLYILAPYLGSFFNSTDSILVIRVIGLTIFAEGLINISVVYFQKELHFNKQFIFQIGGNIVDFIVAVTLAFILHNVWAIIYGSLANSVIRIILSYVLSKYRPKFEFNLSYFKELNNYGKWIAGSNILQFIYSQGDDLLVGKILGPLSLGYYQLAYKISNLPATQITHLISSVMFPAYSQIQSDTTRISKIYLQVLQLIAFLSFFVGTIIILFANDFTVLFLGDKWLPMVPAMQILTIWGVLRSIGATTGPVWQALGTPKVVTKIQTLQVIILVIIIYPFSILWNIAGTSLAVVISALIPNIIAISIISKTIKIEISEIYKENLIPLFGSVLIGVFTFFSRHLIFKEINYLNFIVLSSGSILVYLLYSIIMHKYFNYLFYRNIFKLIKSTSKNKNLLKLISKFELFIK